MAEFCRQCAIALNMYDTDFTGPTFEDIPRGTVIFVICEGCGPTEVNRFGQCIGVCWGLAREHGGTDDPCKPPQQTLQDSVRSFAWAWEQFWAIVTHEIACRLGLHDKVESDDFCIPDRCRWCKRELT